MGSKVNHAGVKGLSPGRKQLARFWNNLHDLLRVTTTLLPDCRVNPGADEKLKKAMGHRTASVPWPLIGLCVPCGVYAGLYMSSILTEHLYPLPWLSSILIGDLRALVLYPLIVND